MSSRSDLSGLSASLISAQVYAPSGAVGVAWPLALAMGMLSAWLFGSIYAVVAVFNPCIGLLSVPIAVIAGCLVGASVGLGTRLGKIRNPKLAGFLGGLAGLLLVGFAWVGFVTVLITRRSQVSATAAYLTFILNPGQMLSFIFGSLLSTGWFSVRGYVPTGVVLLLCWVAEAICLLAPCVVLPILQAAKPFNERLGRWYRSVLHPGWFVIPDRDPRSLQAMQPTDLASLVVGGDQEARLEVTVHYVPASPDDILLSVETVTEKVEEPAKKGAEPDPKKKKVHRHDVLAPHFVARSVLDRLDALCKASSAGSDGLSEAAPDPWAR